jgi:hypothetical protein
MVERLTAEKNTTENDKVRRGNKSKANIDPYLVTLEAGLETVSVTTIL